jgi:Flp pilus assembly protein TadD
MRTQARRLPGLLGAGLAGLAIACSGGLPPAALPALPDHSPLVVPFALNEGMRQWAWRQVDGDDEDLEKMEKLLYALQEDIDGLRLTYREGYTGTAEEAFTTGEVNCLSFSHLLIGLAREIGVSAYYLDVRHRQEYERQDQLLVILGHVTVGFDRGIEQQIVEFRIGPELDHRRSQRISDRRAQAHHYTNRGAEEIQSGRLALALSLLESSVELDPTLPATWLNLGVARRRSGDLDGAEAAYRRSIDADPDYLPAYQNLSGLVRFRGDADSARQLLQLLDRKNNRNPFILLALGDLSFEKGRLAEAHSFFKRAHRLQPTDPDANAAMGLWAQASGREKLAHRWLQRAQSLDATNPRVRRLAAAVGEGHESQVDSTSKSSILRRIDSDS